MTRPARIVSVDPGEAHVGVAVFVEQEGEWECTAALEFNRPDFYSWLQTTLRLGFDRVVYETWQIYPETAQALTGSKCETAECIGVLKWLAEQERVETTEQPASIQTPTLNLLKAQKRRSRAKRDRAGGHALSAELHGWCYLYQTGLIAS